LTVPNISIGSRWFSLPAINPRPKVSPCPANGHHAPRSSYLDFINILTARFAACQWGAAPCMLGSSQLRLRGIRDPQTWWFVVLPDVKRRSRGIQRPTNQYGHSLKALLPPVIDSARAQYNGPMGP